jgi:tetratricopeptide (TPR) repeat protein
MAENIETLCQQAREAMAQRDWERARRHYLQALAVRADAPDVHYGLATVCFQLQDLPSAAHHFKEVTRLDPLRAGAHVNLGAVYNLLGRLDDAVPALRRGIQLDSHRAEGYYNLGLVYRRKEQRDLAIQAYREALRLNPRMADAHFNLANLLLEKEQYRVAAAHYKQAAQLRPGWDKAVQGLAHAGEMAELAEHPPEPEPAVAVAPADRPAAGAGRDLERVVDPHAHGTLLTTLHKATIESDGFGRRFLQVLESEVEPAIKELSSCLLYPESAANDLDECVQRFESAMQNMRNAHLNLRQSLERVHTLGDRLVRS